MTGEALSASPSNRSGRIFLYAGLVLGIVAAAMVAIVLSNATKSDEVTTTESTRVAVVAAQDIPARTRITPQMLKVGVFNSADVDPESFGAISQVVNRVSATDITSGQAITPVRVSETRGEGLTFAISPGMRGISIGVQEVVTAGGNIAPGNYVDVIAVIDLGENPDIVSIAQGLLAGEPVPTPIVAGGKNTLTLTLLQNVRVLAVDQNLPQQQTGGENANSAPNANPNPRAGTVTLEVWPDKAQVLALIDKAATLRLSLRPFGEDVTAPVAPLSAGVE
jgi:Flp pilus assembly protein CpaB